MNRSALSNKLDMSEPPTRKSLRASAQSLNELSFFRALLSFSFDWQHEFIHIPSWTTKKIWEKRFISPMGMIPLLVSPPLPNDEPDEPINGLTCGQCINYSYRAKRKEFKVRYEFRMSEEVSSSLANSLCYCSEARLFTD